jgi:integrase
MAKITKIVWTNTKGVKQERYEARYQRPDGSKGYVRRKKKSDVEKALTAVSHAKNKGTYVDTKGGKITLDAWIKSPASRIQTQGDGKRAVNESYYRNHVRPVMGDMSLSAIAHEFLQEWVESLEEKELAGSTVDQIVRIVRQALDMAVRAKRLSTNEAYDLNLPAVVTKDITILTDSQVGLLADAIDPRFREWLLTAASLGLRFGELGALRVSAINTDKLTVRITESLVNIGGKITVGSPKSKAGKRTLPLDEGTAAILEAACVGKMLTDRLFTAPDGGFIQKSSFRRRFWQPATVAAGLGRTWPVEVDGKTQIRYAGVTPHVLRHTAISGWIDDDATALQVKTWAGHASIRTTYDVYGHLFEERDEAVMAKLNERQIRRSRQAPPSLKVIGGGR